MQSHKCLINLTSHKLSLTFEVDITKSRSPLTFNADPLRRLVPDFAARCLAPTPVRLQVPDRRAWGDLPLILTTCLRGVDLELRFSRVLSLLKIAIGISLCIAERIQINMASSLQPNLWRDATDAQVSSMPEYSHTLTTMSFSLTSNTTKSLLAMLHFC